MWREASKKKNLWLQVAGNAERDEVMAITGRDMKNTVRKISALKARDDELVDFYCDFDFDTFRFLPTSQDPQWSPSTGHQLSMRPSH